MWYCHSGATCGYVKSNQYFRHSDIHPDRDYGSLNNAEQKCNEYDECIGIACSNANPGRCYIVKETLGKISSSSWSWFVRQCGTYYLYISLGSKKFKTLKLPSIILRFFFHFTDDWGSKQLINELKVIRTFSALLLKLNQKHYRMNIYILSLHYFICIYKSNNIFNFAWIIFSSKNQIKFYFEE